METFSRSVAGCGRCGGDHDELDYREMLQPIPMLDGAFTHWATCPETGDPILARMANEHRGRPGRIGIAGHRWNGTEWLPIDGPLLADALRSDDYQLIDADVKGVYLVPVTFLEEGADHA